MEQDNPFSPPTVDLLEIRTHPALSGWTQRQLQVLGALSLLDAIGTLLLGLLSFASAWLTRPEAARLQVHLDYLMVLLTLLGCYLLLRLKALLEQRYGIAGLSRPIWLVIALQLPLAGLSAAASEQLFAGLNAVTLMYLGGLALLGVSLIWLALRLLRSGVELYPSLRTMAWMNLVGGAMLASVLLSWLALLPLILAMFAQTLVFFRAAGEAAQAA